MTTSFNYDNLDRLQNYTDVYNKTTAYSYDANSNVTRLTYPGGYKVDYVFDNNNRMTQCKFNNGSKIIVYTYFDDGRLKKMTYPNGTYTDYAYDAAGRMTSLITKKSSGAIICSYNFTLDALGNHVNVTSVEPYTGPPPLSNHTYSGIYNNENEAIQFADSNMSYDANGEQQSKDGRNINWDIGGMITSSGNRNYVYDGMKLMRQADRSGTVRRYAWDLRGMSNIIVEYNGSGTALYYYIHGQGLCARVSVTNNNDIRYYHSDYRGSTIAMTDAAQIVTHKYQFLPFGEIVQCEESDFDNPFKFVGKWGVMHEGGSYYYMRARQYDAENGRFISEDPVWNRNLFGYAEGNPIEMIDPNGEFAISGVILGTLAIVSALQGIDAVVSALTDQYYADSYRKAGNYEMYKKYQNSADQNFLDFHLGNILDWAVGAGLDKFTSIKGVKSAVKRAGTELFGLSEGALPLIDMRFNSSLELVQQFIEYGIGQTLNSGLNRATSNIYSGSVNVSNVYYSNNQCNLIECVGN